MEPSWTITLFAELTVRAGDGSTNAGVVRRFRSQKVASLLAYLAYHRGRTVSREFLCDMLWPDEPDAEVARNRFRVTLASLRRQLEPPGVPPGSVIENVGNHQVRLRAEAVMTDVAAFESAVRSGSIARAAALYHTGPLLPAFYEDWISPEQERLTQALARLGIAPPDNRESSTEAALPPALPPAAARVSVPTYLTSFFGRDAERDTLGALLADPQARLITLTGPGGIGKTRLAAESVRDDPFLRAFVPLADIWDAGQLGHVLRQALQLPSALNGDSLSQVVLHLNREPKTRIVLDNVEQIAQGTALVIGDLLARVPNLFLIVTSRRRLDFPGEREVIVAPLPLPTSTLLEHVACASSVQLFLNRAQFVRPDYQITTRNAADFSALCHLLDGVPLALELAAARAGSLTPGQIRARLAEKIGDSGSRRDGKENRHRSMNAVIEWSYALLPPDLRRFFLSLSIFRGSWDLDAAEAITGEVHALDYLSRLRGHSLVTAEGERFRLLETVRTWAEERLRDVPIRAALLHRHTDYYRALGEGAKARLGTVDESTAMKALEADEANLRSAFARALGDASQVQTALRFALVLCALGRARGSLSETLDMLHHALALADTCPPTDVLLHARVLLAAGELTQLTQGGDVARSLLNAALPLARQSGDAALTARAMRSLADHALLGNDHETAQPLFREALTLQLSIGDERGAAQTRNSLALLALRKDNDVAEAARLTQEASNYFRAIGDARMLSYNLFNLGEIALDYGEAADAVAYFRESLTLAEEMRDDWQRLYALFALARAANRQEQKDVAHALMRDVLPLALRLGDQATFADALREQAEIARSNGDPRGAVTLLAAAHTNEPRTGEDDAALVNAAHMGLPAASFRAAWSRGAALTPEQAVAVALVSHQTLPDASNADQLPFVTQ